MRILSLIAVTAAAASLAVAAQADNGKARGHDRIGSHQRLAGCPPGLARKNPPCVPPGQAKQHRLYRPGEVIRDDFAVIRDHDRFGLPRHGTYYRIGHNIYRVDRETREVLEFIGAAAQLLD